MRFKTIIDERFEDYKKPSMFIGAVSCNGKCCIEQGLPISVCQNDGWRSGAIHVLSDDEIIQRYLANPITSAVVVGGLEPLEQYLEVLRFICTLRLKYNCMDDVVIYTGYNKDEITDEIEALRRIPNIVIKFGRYVPNQEKHYDEVLGVELASDNQYAERIS